MILDAHLHVWDRARSAYAWLGPHLPEVDRDIRFSEVEPALEEAGVTGVVLVQSDDSAGDTEHLLEVARSTPRVRGVVAWAPLEDPARADPVLRRLREDRRVVGIRNLIHDRDDPEWVLRAGFDESLSVLEEIGLPFDFVTSDHEAIARAATVASRHPDLELVLDHLGKPSLGGSADETGRWEHALRSLAEFPRTTAKVSGLYGPNSREDDWTIDELRRAVDVAVDAFGPERLMYGGDWPMSLRAGGYRRVVDALARCVADWPAPAATQFWGGTAARVYGIEEW